jgi:flagellum-specific ATP synthase
MMDYANALRGASVRRRLGRTVGMTGQGIESIGPKGAIGEVCEVYRVGSAAPLLAEIVGIRQERTVLMPYGDLQGLGADCEVRATGRFAGVGVGAGLLGRVIDASGMPLDGRPMPQGLAMRSLAAPPINPLSRPPIKDLLETGVRAIDTLLPLGKGQRVGIFAGSGVGKSTLLGMLAQHVKSDVNVIALIGERGREVREFIDDQLGPQGLARSVVVVATSDQPALARMRAALTATTIAESFREQGQQVLLMMDSITRFAMARREIGLVAGEPPTARGYTPSVFSEIPTLCERCGTTASGGSITALYTVLVEGDDFNEPISDIVRATLDGHIMLSRELAHQAHFPAIDVLQSTSRLAGSLASAEERRLMHAAVDLLATYERNRQMVEMGAYRAGAHAALDLAIERFPQVRAILRQDVNDPSPRAAGLAGLRAAVEGG